jgi:hypothetical protein
VKFIFVESQPTFQRYMSPPTSVWKNEPSKKPALLCLPPAFMMVSCLAYCLTPKMGAVCSSEMSFTFSGLHSIISQKLELFITTAFYPFTHHISFSVIIRHNLLTSCWQSPLFLTIINQTAWKQMLQLFLQMTAFKKKKKKDYGLGLDCIKIRFGLLF